MLLKRELIEINEQFEKYWKTNSSKLPNDILLDNMLLQQVKQVCNNVWVKSWETCLQDDPNDL